MRTYNLYVDNLHTINAAAPSKTGAWMLIRNECHKRGIPVPTMDKIKLVRKLTEAETTHLKNQSK